MIHTHLYNIIVYHSIVCYDGGRQKHRQSPRVCSQGAEYIMYTNIHIYIYIHIHTYIHTYIYIYIYIHISMCMCIYIYIERDIHVY